MKKTIILAVVSFCLFVTPVSAQSVETTSNSAETVNPTSSIEDKEIKALKEKIATKVAELRKKSNKAVSGDVLEASEKLIKIKTSDGKNYDIKPLEASLTKYFQIAGAIQKEVKLQDVKKGSHIIVAGIINEQSVTANTIFIDESYFIGVGKITEVDKEDYSVKVLTTEKDNYTLDIESYTKQLMMNIKTLDFEKVGFSKIKEGDTIHFAIKKTGDIKEQGRYSAQKILLVPQEYFIK